MKQYKLYSKRPFEVERTAIVETSEPIFSKSDSKFHADFIVEGDNVTTVVYMNDNPIHTMKTTSGMEDALRNLKTFYNKLNIL